MHPICRHPVSAKGDNTPLNLRRVFESLVELRGEEPEALAEQLLINTERLLWEGWRQRVCMAQVLRYNVAPGFGGVAQPSPGAALFDTWSNTSVAVLNHGRA